MPTLWAHQNYFNNSSTQVAPTQVFTPGYPLWQTAAVTLGSGLGGSLPFWERLVDYLSWFWTLYRRSLRCDPQQRAVLMKAMDALAHPAYPLAQLSVKKTATTLGFNRPEAWKELSRELKGNPLHAENAFRHLEACRLVRANLINSTVTNPQCNLIVELAYQGYGWKAAR